MIIMIILYGGSFSPITFGHYLVIINILKKYPNARMIISPVNDNYSIIKGRPPGEEHSLLPYQDRLAMVQLTIDWIKKDYPEFNIEKSDFMGRGTQQYNDAEWIKSVGLKDVYYLVGSDIDFSTWRKEDQLILKKINLLIYPRTNDISSYAIEQKYVKDGTLVNLIPPVRSYFLKHFTREYIAKKLT